MEGDVITMQEIFRQTGMSAEGHAQGRFEATGIRPASSTMSPPMACRCLPSCSGQK